MDSTPSGLPSFSCARHCKHAECRSHAPSPLLEKKGDCLCFGVVNDSSLTLRIVRDMANTLTDIMTICGIPRCKAKLSTDATITALVQCDNIYFCIDAVPKQRIRKLELRTQLANQCQMNSAEVQLASVIVELGFWAFYYVATEDRFNRYRHSESLSRCIPPFMEECSYIYAARKTGEFYKRFGGLSQVEHRRYETKIKEAYSKFVHKMQDYFIKPPCEECNCCVCVRNRAVCDDEMPPCQKQGPTLKCGWTMSGAVTGPAKRKARARQMQKSAAETRDRIARQKFTLDWVKSIWTREDFEQYFQSEIAAFTEPIDLENYCRPLTEAEVDARMAAVEAAANPVKSNSMERFCAKIN